MNEPGELYRDIERLRDRLYYLIRERNEDLQDPEIISASHALNTAINKYNRLLNKKLRD